MPQRNLERLIQCQLTRPGYFEKSISKSVSFSTLHAMTTADRQVSLITHYASAVVEDLLRTSANTIRPVSTKEEEHIRKLVRCSGECNHDRHSRPRSASHQVQDDGAISSRKTSAYANATIQTWHRLHHASILAEKELCSLQIARFVVKERKRMVGLIAQYGVNDECGCNCG